ncbi:TolB-like translocation protein [Chitinasiproducens palmae]|uniref:hypothetical protein n=1 Tax=Chitinasiproducens palmae TaxID=1770053 RepID=UPI001113CF7B|nr:hypothetical protein [Chitinasiproducens palmae]
MPTLSGLVAEVRGEYAAVDAVSVTAEARATAVAAAATAVAARDASLSNGRPYATVAAGLADAAITVGGYFDVIGDGVATAALRYQKTSSTAATLIAATPTAQWAANLGGRLLEPGDFSLSGWVFVLLDKNRKPIFGYHRTDGIYPPTAGADGALSKLNLAGTQLQFLDPDAYALAGLDGQFVCLDKNRKPIPDQSKAYVPPEAGVLVYEASDGTSSQIYLEARATGKREQLSTGGGNNTNPRITGDGAVIWKTDRTPTPRAGLMYATLAAKKEYAALSNNKLALIGTSLIAQIDPSWYGTPLGVDVYNFGGSGQISQACAARVGALALAVTVDGGVIPADASQSVSITFASGVSPGIEHGGQATGTILGVAVKMNTASTPFTVSRAVSGAAVAVPAGSLLTMDPRDYYGVLRSDAEQCVAILQISRNNVGPRAIKDTATIVEWIKTRAKHFLIYAEPNSNTETKGTSGYGNLLQFNKDLQARWPDNYATLGGFDHRTFAVNAYNDRTLLPNPTSQDATDYANDLVCTSLRKDGLHWSDALYKYVAVNFGIPILRAKGWLA